MADESPYRVHPEGTHWATGFGIGEGRMRERPTTKRMDILDVTSGLIVHQINPHVMGAGLALLIRKRYPKVYIDFLEHKVKGRLNLGYVIVTKVDSRLSIASYVGQLTYGRTGVHTSMSAVGDALYTIEHYAYKQQIKNVYIPWKMGCGLAGGNWDEISLIIADRLPGSIICKLGVN